MSLRLAKEVNELLINFTIRKYKNYGIITPLPTDKLARALKNCLSYEKKGIEFMPNPLWGIVYFYNIKKGTFPWGLLDKVKNVMNQYAAKVEPLSWQIAHIPLMHQMITGSSVLRPYQLTAVNELIKNGGGILSVPTGGGKTMIALEYLRYIGRRAVIIVTTLDIKRQWEEQTVGDANIKVINYQNKSCLEYTNWAEVIVFDECHHAPCKNIFKLAMTANTNAILVGLSATPWREDGEDMRLLAALGQIVYKIDRSQLIEEGWLSNAVVKYVDVDYDVEPFLNYADEYKRYIVENGKRNNLIASIANAEAIHYKKKVLILVNHIQHGEKIQKLTDASVFLNGGVVDRTVDLTKTDIIIATSIFNEGINLPSLDVLILAGGGKSSIQLTQRVGRVLRVAANKVGAVVYDFKDKGRYLYKHYKRRRGLLEADFEVIDI